MTADGVIPHHNPIREVGRVEDADGIEVAFCVDRGLVRLEVGSSIVQFGAGEAEEFAQMFLRACWEAAVDG